MRGRDRGSERAKENMMWREKKTDCLLLCEVTVALQMYIGPRPERPADRDS